MPFWSTEKIKEVAKTWDLVKPYEPERIDCGSYHLSVGSEVFVTSTGGTKKLLETGQQVSIPPGQLAIVVTEEAVHVPAEAIGFISMRASVKLGGLINVSGFHVDPGYQAPLKFSIYNAGEQPAVISRGDPMFLIWFADLDRSTSDLYRSDPKKHGVITSTDVSKLQGTMPTPAALKAEIDELKSLLKSTRYWIATVVTGVIAGLIVWGLTKATAPPSSSQAAKPDAGAPRDATSAPDAPLALPDGLGSATGSAQGSAIDPPAVQP